MTNVPLLVPGALKLTSGYTNDHRHHYGGFQGSKAETRLGEGWTREVPAHYNRPLSIHRPRSLNVVGKNSLGESCMCHVWSQIAGRTPPRWTPINNLGVQALQSLLRAVGEMEETVSYRRYQLY